MPTNYTLSDLQNESIVFQDLVRKTALELKTAIDLVITSGGVVSFPNYPFTRTKFTALTDKAGFYLIYCSKNKKFYLGSTTNLAQRKGEHGQALRLKVKLVPKILIDITQQNLDITDFSFVILKQLSPQLINEITQNCQKADNITFFLLMVEEMSLQDLVLDPRVPPLLYNSKTTSGFFKGNPGGSHGKGGSPKVCVGFKGFGWSSISNAAVALGVDRKTIRNHIENGSKRFVEIKYISQDEFNALPDDKKNVKKV